MRIGQLAEVWRYPVKSMAGERRRQAALTEGGLAGDRGWAVRDEQRGGIVGAKKIPQLMQCAARYVDEPGSEASAPAEIVLPDGSTVRSTAADVSARLSTALGRSVTLWPRLPAEIREHYRRAQPDHADMETELRAVFGRTAEEPLPDLSVFPPELFEFESLPGTYFDAFPLLVMTRASLTELQRRLPEAKVDVRRFRPNFLVATDEEAGFPETAWIGRRLRIGNAVMEILVDCPRCVMVTHEFADLPRDPTIMRGLVRETDGKIGVYAKVVEPGTVAEGDAVELL